MEGEGKSSCELLSCDPSNKGSPCVAAKVNGRYLNLSLSLYSVSYDISLIGTWRENKNGNADRMVVGAEP